MEIRYAYLQTDNEISGALEQLLKAPLLAIDTETTGLDPHTSDLLLLQISDVQNNYVFNLLADNSFSRKDVTHPNWKMLQAILQGPATKIAHNMVFDFKMMRAHFGYEMKNLYDTMLAERILTVGKEGVPKKMPALKNIVPKYTDLTSADMKKGIRAGFYAGYVIKEFSEAQIEYSARDTAVLLPIYYNQMFQLQDQDMVGVMELEADVIPVIASMEYMGVNLDIEVWRRAIKELDAERVHHRRQANEYLKPLSKQESLFEDYCSLSVDSNTQMIKALRQLGLPIEDSVNRQVLERLEVEHPIIKSILEYRKLQKLVTGYGEGLIDKINPITGRLHGSFGQIVDTGRTSSRDPNLQNIPSAEKCALRDCFVAPEGYVCLGADYGAQELRIIAAVSGEDNMLTAFKQGKDIHTSTAALVFKRDIDEMSALLKSREHKLNSQQSDLVTKEEKEANSQRKIAKNCNFLIAYSGGPTKLAATANITENFAKEVMGNHARAFPALKDYIRDYGNLALQNLYSTTLLGRKRFYWLPDTDSPDYFKIQAAVKRQGVNHVVQGTAGDMLKAAMVLTHNNFDDKFGRENAYLWSVVHDELQCIVREDLVEEAQKVLVDSMQQAFYKFIPEDVCYAKVDSQWDPHHWVH
jgi:DNA polymerase-1